MMSLVQRHQVGKYPIKRICKQKCAKMRNDILESVSNTMFIMRDTFPSISGMLRDADNSKLRIRAKCSLSQEYHDLEKQPAWTI